MTGALVNIREGASAETAILGQVSEGTILRVDRDTVETLSDNQKIAIDQRKGWQPVLLSKDRRGYIYSLYLRPQS
ncbi:MAG: SH3 domain-containing protein [Cyanobacteria bacterium J06627_28]